MFQFGRLKQWWKFHWTARLAGLVWSTRSVQLQGSQGAARQSCSTTALCSCGLVVVCSTRTNDLYCLWAWNIIQGQGQALKMVHRPPWQVGRQAGEPIAWNQRIKVQVSTNECVRSVGTHPLSGVVVALGSWWLHRRKETSHARASCEV